MAELISNVLAASDGAITTLAAPVASAGATTITVAVAAPTALRGGQFRIRVGNELMRVTGGQNTTTWTVERATEGTTASTYASGAKVRHVLSAAALFQIFDDALARAGADIVQNEDGSWPDRPTDVPPTIRRRWRSQPGMTEAPVDKMAPTDDVPDTYDEFAPMPETAP